MAKVQVEVALNTTFDDGERVRRPGELVEVDRDEYVESLIRHGSLLERKTVRRGARRAETTTRRAVEKR
jgi:hypothetical protein